MTLPNPQLKVFTSLWAMQPHDRSGAILSIEEVVNLVADAGFDGLAIDLGVADIEQARKAVPIIANRDLQPLIVAFPRTVSSLRDTLLMSRDFGSPFVVVIGQVMPVSLAGMIPVIRKWLEMADEVGIPVQFETHRNCITNDMFTTLQLLDAVPEMRLSADLSHYVVDREIRLPLSHSDNSLFGRILERSDSFQGRVASRQQIQLQLDFPQHLKWLEQFKDWWREGFANWLRQQREDDCVFLCELGPPEYAMTDRNGYEMSDRWQESLTLMDIARNLWVDCKDHKT